MKKIETSALIGLGALGILFGRKIPGVQVIADKARIARYSAEPVVCNGEECQFTYVTPEEGRPVDLLLVAVKATVLEQAIRDMAKFVGPDTVIDEFYTDSRFDQPMIDMARTAFMVSGNRITQVK